MSNKVLLVRPYNIYGMQNYPPLGLALVGTALEREGYDVEIAINNNNESGFDEALLTAAEDALFVGFTITTAEVQDAIRLAKMLREKFGEELPLVWGGWHSTLFPEQMRDSGLVDFAVVGEGERCLIDIANHFAGKNEDISPNQILPGALHLVGEHKLFGKVMKNANFDINELAFPNYSLIRDIESYITRPLTDKFEEYYDRELRWLPYESSRGCPYHCAFCINEVTDNNRYRQKSAEKTASEMLELVERYGLTHIKIIDDLFFVDIKRTRKIFELVREARADFTWDAECRTDYIRKGFMDDATFALLKETGLIQLTFGIESGSEDTLLRMQKGGNAGPEFAIRAIRECAKHGIASRGSFILDSPGDTKEDLFKTVRLIRKLRPFPRFACGVHTYRPYPKSPMCEELIANGTFYQPEKLEGWEDEAVVRQFTDTAIVKEWLPNWRLSSKISFFESLESGFWLKSHQLRNPILRSINRAFMKLASFRNRKQWYGFALDRPIYIWFKDRCIHRFAYKQAKVRPQKLGDRQGALVGGGFWGAE